MKQTTADSIAERLNRVEKQNRRLMLLSSLLVAGLASIALLGAAGKHGPVIEAEQFVVKGDAGHLRIALGFSLF